MFNKNVMSQTGKRSECFLTRQAFHVQQDGRRFMMFVDVSEQIVVACKRHITFYALTSR
jgi:hypothetical protein